MDAYSTFLRDVLTDAGEIYFQRVAAELQKFADTINQWLHELFERPRPDWREGLDWLLAQQAAEGRVATLERRQELLAFLEGWAKSLDWSAVNGMQGQGRPMATATAIEGAQTANSPRQPVRHLERIVRPTRMTEGQSRFYQKLAEAKSHLDEIEKILAALGQKMDRAKPDEVVEVETEVDAVEELIWRHNDAMESARLTWLQFDLGYHTYNRLAAMSSPSAFGQPMFPDEQQAQRARTQLKQIGERTGQSIANLDSIILGMQAVQWAGTLASVALGAGVVINAVQPGGKWAIVKTVAKLGAAGAAGEAVEAGLRAAGASEETIHGVRLAAELVTWLLLL